MILNKTSKILDLLREANGNVVMGDWTLNGLNLNTDTPHLSLSLRGTKVWELGQDEGTLIEKLNEEFSIAYTWTYGRPYIAILDYIYNIAHNKVVKNNGTLYQSAINECVTRYNNESNYPYTDYLYNQLVANGLDRDSFDYSPGRFEYLVHGTDPSKVWCTRNTVSARINGEVVSVPAHLDFTKWGYKKIQMRTRPDRDTFESWVPKNEVLVTINGLEYPKAYADRHFPLCTSCNSRTHKLFLNKCPACLGVDPDKVVIRGYSDRAPDFLKFKEGKYSRTLFKTPLYLGVELELESDGRRGQDGLDKGLLFAAKTLGDHCIFKRDGSIQNGFEIVSTAATLDVHRTEWKDFFAGVESETYLGKRDNVGMHVHVSREPLNFLTQGKMTEFMNREDNKPYLKSIAGRWSEHYARQEKGRTVTYPFLTNEASERYNALNLRNQHTVEFRIFAATTSYDEFVMRLEFCEALASYCSPCQSKATSLKDVTKWEWFAKYVQDNYKQWHLLAKFIKGL